MISWGQVLTAQQIQELVDFILQFEIDEAGATEQLPPAPDVSSFAKNVIPIFDAKCISCHGSMGGWNGTTYESVISLGITDQLSSLEMSKIVCWLRKYWEPIKMDLLCLHVAHCPKLKFSSSSIGSLLERQKIKRSVSAKIVINV